MVQTLKDLTVQLNVVIGFGDISKMDDSNSSLEISCSQETNMENCCLKQWISMIHGR